MEAAIKKLKQGKAPIEDGITAGILQDEGEPNVKTLTKFLNRSQMKEKSHAAGRMLLYHPAQERRYC